MYWADDLAASVSGPQVVNDSKTPSGTVHVGSLRGPVVHDAIWRALRERGVEAEFRYGVDDLDAMDAAALLTSDAVDRYMGVPLAHVPAPEGSAAPSYARHFVGTLFLPTFERLGIRPEFYWMSEVYGSGRMDQYIRMALDRADLVREIYQRVSHVVKVSHWLPLQPICERCGRVGTTIASDWDGETVAYECLPDFVTWARGCGNRGRISPFGGRATLPWNLDWAAKWSLFDITIEGCGKDLATAGGSRDRSDAIAREVFEREPPVNVAYEFLNVGGRKMSTSKGTGAAAHTIADVVSPELLRFLFLRPKPNQAIEFDPEGDTIPRLFDELDRIAAATGGREVKGELPPNHDRLFAASLPDPDADVAAEAAAFRPPFGHLALLVQIPSVDIPALMTAEKGSPLTIREIEILDERVRVAARWLETYAPERARLVVRRDRLPAEARELGEDQRLFLGALALDVSEALSAPDSGDSWQAAIFRVAQEAAMPPGRAFGALYIAFLGRTNGPRAGWLLASLEPEFVVRRLREAAGWRPAEAEGTADVAGPA